MKKFSINESKSISNEDIIDCLSDYYDNDSLVIEDGWVNKNNYSNKKEYFSKSDLSNTRKAKIIKIKIGDYDDGININMGPKSIPISMINDISKSLNEVNRFSKLVSDDISFSLNNEYGKVNLSILIKLDNIQESDLNSDLVDGFIKEIKNFLDTTTAYGKKRKKLGENWLEMTFKDWRHSMYLSDQIKQMNIGTCKYSELNEIGERIRKSGFKVVDVGGDCQSVIQLKKI